MKIYVSLTKKNRKLLKYAILFVLACILIYYSSILNVNATSSTTSTILSDITFPLAVEIRDNISGFPSLNFGTSYGYDESYTSAWINKENIIMNSTGVVVSIPAVLECGHSYVLYNYWAVNGAYMIDYSASSSRLLGVGLGLGDIPNLSITEGINAGRFPTFEYVTTVAVGLNQYADFTHVSMSYIKFTNNTCNGAQRNLYFSQMSNISSTFQTNKLAYLGYRLIDTTTLSSSDHAQLDRIEESINNLTLADVENKLNEIQEEQKNTSDAIDEQTKQDQEQHEEQMEQDKQQHEETMDTITDSSDPDLALGDTAGWLPPGPVDSVLNLPLTILNSLISNLSNKTCNAVNVPLPYVNKTIQLPCLSTIFEKIGFTDVLNTITIPFAIYIYINTLIKLYGWVDKTLQFREEHWNDVDQWGGI